MPITTIAITVGGCGDLDLAPGTLLVATDLDGTGLCDRRHRDDHHRRVGNSRRYVGNPRRRGLVEVVVVVRQNQVVDQKVGRNRVGGRHSHAGTGHQHRHHGCFDYGQGSSEVALDPNHGDRRNGHGADRPSFVGLDSDLDAHRNVFVAIVHHGNPVLCG